jgi:hypothetical protein
MSSDDTHRRRARDVIDASRRGHLPKPRQISMSSDCDIFNTAPKYSIELYDDKFGRNTVLTRSARMRKFKFYQYKPVADSPSTSNNSNRDDDPADRERKHCPAGSPQTPVLLPREDVIHGKLPLVTEQSKELSELDTEISELEKKIANLNQRGIDGNVDCLDEIFALVNKKNDLLRRQMQLNIIEQEKVLEKANQELTKELRSLLSIDDSLKTKAQLERQQYLYDQSLALVSKRDELVHHLDVQERCIEDDNALKATLKHSKDKNCVIQ